MRNSNRSLSIVFLGALASTTSIAGGTLSGLGLPEYGGGLSGISQPGVFGIGYNPAAAISEETTLLIDVGLMGTNFTATLTGQEPLIDNSIDPVPFGAITMPIGDRMGLGFNLGAPYSRSGSSNGNESQRFHSMDGGLLVLQLDSSVAYVVNDNLTIGAGTSLAHVSATSLVAIDTGAILYSLYGGEAESLIGEPFMEGTRTLENGRAIGLGGNVGFRYQSDAGFEATGSYRSQITTTLRGKVLIRPSNTLNLILEGDLKGDVVIPMEAQYSITVPAGPVKLTAEGCWVDWSATSETAATVENMVVVSEDTVGLQILESYGLTDPELLGSAQSVGVNGFRDTIAYGARIGWSNSSWNITAGAMFAPNATPDEWVHPGNMDFQSTDYHIGALHKIDQRLSLGYSAAYIEVKERTITNSTASFTAPIGTAPTVPSGNGSYSLDLWRVGLSVLYRL